MSTKQQKPMTIIHEFDGSGNHRIITLFDDGTNGTSTWFPVASIANFYDLFANANSESGLPFGVFTVKSAPAQILGAK